MIIGKINYNRVSRKMPCPVCEHLDWCLVSDDGKVAICTRTKSMKEYKSCSGWLHVLNGQNFTVVRKVVKTTDYKPNIEIIRQVYRRLNWNDPDLMRLEKHLKISHNILRSMGVRSCGNDVWGFPMYDSNLNIIGIKKRNLNNKKWCVRHSRLGVYLSNRFTSTESVYICEGESDTAAMLSRGYNACGRASATSCRAILRELLADCPEIIIIADFDDHGRGYVEAVKLAKVFERRVYIVLHRAHKDIREWINSGTFTHAELMNLKIEYLEQ